MCLQEGDGDGDAGESWFSRLAGWAMEGRGRESGHAGCLFSAGKGKEADFPLNSQSECSSAGTLILVQ